MPIATAIARVAPIVATTATAVAVETGLGVAATARPHTTALQPVPSRGLLSAGRSGRIQPVPRFLKECMVPAAPAVHRQVGRLG